MLWLKYLAFLPLHIAVVLLRYPLAPIAVYWSVAVFGQWKLVTPFKWLDTIDNDLRGDGGHHERCREAEREPEDFVSMVVWIWRNGGNWFNYYPLGCAGDDPHPFIRTSTNAMFGWNMAGKQCLRAISFAAKLNFRKWEKTLDNYGVNS